MDIGGGGLWGPCHKLPTTQMSTKHEEGYATASWLCGRRQIAHLSELSFLIGTVEIITILPHRSGEGNGTRLQYSCLEKSHERRSLVGCSPWGRKELDTTE